MSVVINPNSATCPEVMEKVPTDKVVNSMIGIKL